VSGIEDDLTGLHGRRSFLSLLRRHIGMANDRQQALALVVVDLDGFARINGAFGYEAGDRILQHLAGILRQVARAQDYAARIGSDRFALLLPRIMNAGHAELAVQKLFRLLDSPFRHGEQQLRLSATAGIALCPAHATHADFLLRQAEKAVARARTGGLRSAFAADSGGDALLSQFWDIEIELDSALENGQIALYYQPQLRIHDHRPVGVEALMRWYAPARGEIPADVFIPVAESTGQIRKLTMWALNTALRQAGRWRHPWGELAVAVNVPAGMVAQQDLPELVENAMRLWGGAQARLVLEITERSLMDADHSFAVLSRIRALGARVSIDDFGTGYSCLARFRDIPADELKIDRSFVQGLLGDPASRHVASLVVELAHRFGLSVVGEGVEDEATLQALQALDCDIAQGYLFGKAMPGEQVQAWLQDPGRIATADAPGR
jgi:diguanylate cyclase (GGDEF)-like protein